MKPLHIMPLIFNVVKHFVVSHSKNYYTIEKIEKINPQGIYVVTFFSAKRRQFFVKSTKEIMQDEKLIRGFNPLDAVDIGMYTAKTHYEKLNKPT